MMWSLYKFGMPFSVVMFANVWWQTHHFHMQFKQLLIYLHHLPMIIYFMNTVQAFIYFKYIYYTLSCGFVLQMCLTYAEIFSNWQLEFCQCAQFVCCINHVSRFVTGNTGTTFFRLVHILATASVKLLHATWS